MIFTGDPFWVLARQAAAFGNLYIKRNHRHAQLAFPRLMSYPLRGTLDIGRRTGRSLPAFHAQARITGGGKSELRRAVCRITSGTRA